MASKTPTEVTATSHVDEEISIDSIVEAATHEASVEAATHEASSEHEGPHIPTPKGKIIEGWSIG